MIRLRPLCAALSLVLATVGLVPSASAAETSEIRIIQQYGLSYLPLVYAVDQKLIDRELAARGLTGGKASLVHANSGAVANDMLLSGAADIAAGGVTVLATLWDKSRGRNEVRGMVTLCDTPMYVTTIDPRIKTIRDFGPNDKIAVSAIKITLQALTLEMASVKEFGWDDRFHLDPMTVSMAHPEAVASMLSDKLEVKSYVATIPFNFQVLADPRVRLLMTSYDVLGGSHTTSVAWTTKAWKEANPKTYEAVAAAFEAASDAIGRDRKLAAEVFLRNEKSNFTLEQIVDFIGRENDMLFSTVPHRVTPVAHFMYGVGTIKNKPADWKELFWENMQDKPGS